VRGEHGTAVQRAVDVDLHGAGGGLGIGVGQRADVAEQARVVDPQVDPSEPRHHVFGKSLDGGPVGHVHRGQDGCRTGLHGQRGLVASAQCEVQSGGGEVDGQPGPQAATGSGDDGHVAAGRRAHALRRTERSCA
jgi:hypothetical protein